jgi:hypothetical protein
LGWAKKTRAARIEHGAAKVSVMRYPKVMLRSVFGVVVCAGVAACATSATSQGGSMTAMEQALSEEDDLGDPRGSIEERRASARARDEAQAQALLDDPNTTRVDFDGDEANDAPVDVVMIPPDRSPSKSLIQDITMGPSS